MSVPYLLHVFVEAEREFDERVIAAEPVREVVERAENAVMRLIETEPVTADDERWKDALLARVAAERLFPALTAASSANL